MKAIVLLLLSSGTMFAAARIDSFTVACSPTAPPGTAVTCPAGNDLRLRWKVSGASGVSIDHGLGAVNATTGQATVQPFRVPAITYTLTAEPGNAKAQVTITISDDYALVKKWPSVVRSYGFDNEPAHSPHADPGIDANARNTYDHLGYDPTQGVSGSGSLKFTIPAVSGDNANGQFHINFCGDFRNKYPCTISEGQEIWIQFRRKQNRAYITNNYIRGSSCPANLTMSRASGKFTVGERVVATGSTVSGTVASWDGTRLVLTGNSQARGLSWEAGHVVKGQSSGATATVLSNNGGGSACLRDGPTAPKNYILGSADQPPAPLTDQQGYAKPCQTTEIVLNSTTWARWRRCIIPASRTRG